MLGASDSGVREREINRLMDAGFAMRSGKAATVAAALGVTSKKALASGK